MQQKKRNLFLICTGLGIVKRGFETYIADLAEKLRNEDYLFKTTLFSGGSFHGANQLFCISRNNSFWKKLIGVKFTSELELITFFFSLLIKILVKNPTAIYLGEYKLYCYLFKIRKLFRLKFSLILYTGGQVSPGLFDFEKDYVHHITDIYYDDLLRSGYPKERQYVLPHFIANNLELESISNNILRDKAGKKKIIISVGIIDNTIKRMDQFVKVLSDQPNLYFPVILGEFTNETQKIIQDLEHYFGKDNFFVGKVSKEELYSYLKEADLFMLLSPKESFGLASLEALSVGLPLICCDFHESRYVLKNQAKLINCNDVNQIRAELKNTLNNFSEEFIKQDRIDFVKNNYSWAVLEKKYISMFNTALGFL